MMLLRSLSEPVSVLFHSRTFSLRNPYFVFGLLIGLPIPIILLLSLILGTGSTPSSREITVLLTPEAYIFCALQPLILAACLGALGTERWNKERKLEEALRRNRATSRPPNLNALAKLAHDLKTPLVPILGYAEMLNAKQFGELQDRQREALACIIRNSRRLEGLVCELSVLVRPLPPIERSWSTLENSVNPVLEKLGGFLRSGSRCVEVALAEPSRKVLVDTDLLDTALADLLTFAHEFAGPRGSISLASSSLGHEPLEIVLRGTALDASEPVDPGRLAVARQVLSSHGSELILVQNPNTFEVRFTLEAQAKTS